MIQAAPEVPRADDTPYDDLIAGAQATIHWPDGNSLSAIIYYQAIENRKRLDSLIEGESLGAEVMDWQEALRKTPRLKNMRRLEVDSVDFGIPIFFARPQR